MFFSQKSRAKTLVKCFISFRFFFYLVPVQNRNGHGQVILGENQDDIDGGKY